MMAEPPLLAGAVKATETWPSPAVAAPMVGAAGAVRMLTVCVLPPVYAAMALPTSSTMLVEPLRLTFSVPLPEIPLTVTVTGSPLEAETLATVPAAEPVTSRVKSSVETLLTVSLKSTMKSTVVSVDCAPPAGVMLVTEGAMLSTVALVVSAVLVALPALSVAVTVTLALVASMLPATMG